MTWFLVTVLGLTLVLAGTLLLQRVQWRNDRHQLPEHLAFDLTRHSAEYQLRLLTRRALQQMLDEARAGSVPQQDPWVRRGH